MYSKYRKTKTKRYLEHSEHDFTKAERTSLIQDHALDQYILCIMITTLLLRPHNSALAAMFILLQHCIVGILLPWLQWKVWAVTLLHVWMAEVAFSSQVCALFTPQISYFICSHYAVTGHVVTILSPNYWAKKKLKWTVCMQWVSPKRQHRAFSAHIKCDTRPSPGQLSIGRLLVAPNAGCRSFLDALNAHRLFI